MNRTVKGVLSSLGLAMLLGGLAAAAYVVAEVRAFDASVATVHAVALPPVAVSSEPAALARGQHLVRSIGACASGDCHGGDLRGGRRVSLGPVGTIQGPNITTHGMLSVYSDAELARLITTGVKRDGRSVLMMPVQDFSWLPPADVAAIITYLRTVAPSDAPSGATSVGIIGKVLDRRDEFVWDVARRVQASPRELPPEPEATAAYGRFVVRLCTGCHGESLSGGPLPGAPASIPVPTNLTRHETGLARYRYEDFVRALRTGVRPDGSVIDPFMALDVTKNLDDVELGALWAELQARPSRPFGGR